MGRYDHVTASGTLIGSPGAPLYLADVVLLSAPPQVGQGIEVRGLDDVSLPIVQRHRNHFWINDVVVSGRVTSTYLLAESVTVDGELVWASAS